MKIIDMFDRKKRLLACVSCRNCDSRVLRGGACCDFPGSLGCALRDGAGPDGREDGIGFRVVCRSQQGFGMDR